MFPDPSLAFLPLLPAVYTGVLVGAAFEVFQQIPFQLIARLIVGLPAAVPPHMLQSPTTQLMHIASLEVLVLFKDVGNSLPADLSTPSRKRDVLVVNDRYLRLPPRTSFDESYSLKVSRPSSGFGTQRPVRICHQMVSARPHASASELELALRKVMRGRFDVAISQPMPSPQAVFDASATRTCYCDTVGYKLPVSAAARSRELGRHIRSRAQAVPTVSCHPDVNLPPAHFR